MISLGVVTASFLIGAEATTPQILIGIGVILLCGAAVGLVNAGLIRGVKIPSIIATLATLSILNGIALTLRPTAQGVISPDLVSVLTATVGPIPVWFIVMVAAAGLADLWLHGSRSGLELRATGFDAVGAGGARVRAVLEVPERGKMSFRLLRIPCGHGTSRCHSFKVTVFSAAARPSAGRTGRGPRGTAPGGSRPRVAS